MQRLPRFSCLLFALFVFVAGEATAGVMTFDLTDPSVDPNNLAVGESINVTVGLDDFESGGLHLLSSFVEIPEIFSAPENLQFLSSAPAGSGAALSAFTETWANCDSIASFTVFWGNPNGNFLSFETTAIAAGTGELTGGGLGLHLAPRQGVSVLNVQANPLQLTVKTPAQAGVSLASRAQHAPEPASFAAFAAMIFVTSVRRGRRSRQLGIG